MKKNSLTFLSRGESSEDHPELSMCILNIRPNMVTTGLFNVANFVDFLLLDEKVIFSQAFISNDVVFEHAMEKVKFENVHENVDGKVVEVDYSKPNSASCPDDSFLSNYSFYEDNDEL